MYIIIFQLMTAVAEVALKPNELNQGAIEQQKEKWAKRDYFVDLAIKDLQKLKGDPVCFQTSETKFIQKYDFIRIHYFSRTTKDYRRHI